MAVSLSMHQPKSLVTYSTAGRGGDNMNLTCFVGVRLRIKSRERSIKMFYTLRDNSLVEFSSLVLFIYKENLSSLFTWPFKYIMSILCIRKIPAIIAT